MGMKNVDKRNALEDFAGRKKQQKQPAPQGH
jgi:hypothetical protein